MNLIRILMGPLINGVAAGALVVALHYDDRLVETIGTPLLAFLAFVVIWGISVITRTVGR